MSFYLYSFNNNNCIASLKSFGEKTANLFERKKKEVEQIAAEKAVEVQLLAEEQAQKAVDAIAQTSSDANEVLNSKGA